MKIILYTKMGCSWSDEILDLFKEKNIVFEEREVRNNPAYFKELVLKSGQDKAPTLDIDGEILPDSDREAVEAFLKQKGI